ncbi:CUB and zona pellucida-like domain-containing protein 1 [Mercenaria mercenaria]|uniref:CUB and zona pellucida-like domain-containing protein 1 n=1 Tax=Mercenaria mercenaria TaxID=6596 RepID=UPI00234EAA46|nr:CUB and zona pellucida-like domain-containing protein 1 [Mercenaria mercenaria]
MRLSERTGWDGRVCSADVDECKERPCQRGEACHNNQGSYACIAEHFGSLSTPSTTTHVQAATIVENLIFSLFKRSETGRCHPSRLTSSGWNISIDLSILKQLYPTVTPSNIYFGDNSCRGKVIRTTLVFQQGFRDCLTSERVSSDTLLYENDLFYAIYDPINPFIIRQHKWTFTVEYDVSRNEATSSHVHHDVDAHHAAVASHYDIKMTFFKDANFMNQIAGNPVHASIGDDIYVKVFTSAADWTVKMRLHTCYTKPTDDAADDMTYFFIKDGCEVDSNTHIISQSTHETRFVFRDFEYSTNKEGLNIYCNATFCETKDYSPGIAQSCVSQGTQALVGK